ncbi:nuclear pore protein-like protein [Apiospora saccharicola]
MSLALSALAMASPLMEKRRDNGLQKTPALEWNFWVSSRTLARASSVWKMMLFGGFAESKPKEGDWIVSLPDDSSEAMSTLLGIVSLPHRPVVNAPSRPVAAHRRYRRGEPSPTTLVMVCGFEGDVWWESKIGNRWSKFYADTPTCENGPAGPWHGFASNTLVAASDDEMEKKVEGGAATYATKDGALAGQKPEAPGASKPVELSTGGLKNASLLPVEEKKKKADDASKDEISKNEEKGRSEDNNEVETPREDEKEGEAAAKVVEEREDPTVKNGHRHQHKHMGS